MRLKLFSVTDESFGYSQMARHLELWNQQHTGNDVQYIDWTYNKRIMRGHTGSG